MKIKAAFIALLLLAPVPVMAESFKAKGTVDVYFSPLGGTTVAVVKEINAAKSEILIQAYSFTSAPIAKALVNAQKRGVKIVAVLDKS